MRFKCTTSLITGDELAKTIYNERGIALVQQGMQLTEKMIGHLIRKKIKYVYIADAHDHLRVDKPYEVDLASTFDVVITSCHI